MQPLPLQQPSVVELSHLNDASDLRLLPEDSELLHAQKHAPVPQQIRRWLQALSALVVLPLVLSIAALGVSLQQRMYISSSSATSNLVATAVKPGTGNGSNAVRMAFGSCTAYDLRPQPIWTQGVIRSQPHAWLWLGDMAYMDDPIVDCHVEGGFPECNCTADWIRRPPTQCFAADPVHAQMRMQHQLSIPEYRAFLGYMCPGAEVRGVYPPTGTDPTQCRYPIMGVYDDHDYGWNNGDSRNPVKHTIKNIFLDGIGEPANSPRRSSMTGLQTRYTLRGSSLLQVSPSGTEVDQRSTEPQGMFDRDVELVLLDGRYHRETMPCSRRRELCERSLNSSSPDPWCKDFLVTGGPGKTGSCCRKDDEWAAWCSTAPRSHLQWRVLCDPTSSDFAAQQVILAADNKTVLANSDALWDDAGDLWLRLLEASSSPLCEVLGPQQRTWLSSSLHSSPAPVKIIASGSVLIPDAPAHGPSACSGDDWACWRRAQLHLLHTLANASVGCPVVLVGDYHWSDLKVVLPGADQPYAAELQSAGIKKPVYQVMASGLTTSTARSAAAPCQGSLMEDTLGARPLGRCSYVAEPAFGMVEVDWEQRVMTLSIRNHSTGDVAFGKDGQLQRLRVSLQTCQLL